jgi:hypothetical protein
VGAAGGVDVLGGAGGGTTGVVDTTGGAWGVRLEGAAGGETGGLALAGGATEEGAPWVAAAVPELRVTTP